MAKNYDFKEIEENTTKFWNENKIIDKVRNKNKDKKKFYFLDGPPYTSGRVHIGTTWNKCLKDLILRYKRMKGFCVWDRAGYDMHGMPIEQATMKELNIESRDEIKKIGISKFIQECKKTALKNMKLMNEDFKKMGVWMDFDNAYQPISKEFIEGEWWLIKKAHENNRLYKGEKTMTWCSNCETSLAKHELEYENINDNSIFLKFKIEGTENEYLVIWTTTPWTIPFNLGVMVNPDEFYVKVKIKNSNEELILAKDLVKEILKENLELDYEILEEFKGEKLKGLKYIHPLNDELKPIYDELKIKSPKIHSVVLSKEYVTTTSGSGLVHMAPGCGPEDYEVGHKEGIKPFNNLTRSGIFPKEMNVFKGYTAKLDDEKFVDYFSKKKDMLLFKQKINHDYAHCWRCKKPIIYRTTKQWFFKIEDLKENMREINKEINWIPKYAGSKNYDSWLENLRDNGITRQIYWGTPLPIWVCNECKTYEVIGSVNELKVKANEIPQDLHKPWIDEVKWNCKCGGEMIREPDVLDVWIDSGSASWNCLNFPQEKEKFEKMFPADFILEGIDQIRGWFNLLFVASMVSMQKPSFKAVYMHGFVQDSLGRKMSKSLGNYILPEEVIEKYGADTLRYYMIGSTSPGNDINYNFDDMKLKHKNLGVLWNIKNLILNFAQNEKIELKIPDKNDFGISEKFIYSKLNSSIKEIEEKLDRYKLNEAPLILEKVFLELSRKYIQLNRDKLSIGTKKEKELVFNVIFDVLFKTLKLFSMVCPYISEAIYQEFKEELKLEKKSIHEFEFEKYDEELINFELEEEFEIAFDAIQSILYGREKIQLGQRWPLKECIIVSNEKKIISSIEKLKEIIINQTNVKNIKTTNKFELGQTTIKPNVAEIGKEFGSKKDTIIERIMSMNFDSLLEKIKNEGQKMTINGEEITLKEKHIQIIKNLPEHLIEIKFKFGKIYIDKTRNKELDSEGFAREIMRRVQTLRKKHDLKKTDLINLRIKTNDEELEKMLSKHSEIIMQKVGASAIEIFIDGVNHKILSSEKIKGKEVEISIKEE
ncbi:MAG: isoleucine--tRNA ligase [Candidatus Woesearchaeota archaeon]